MGTGRLFGAHRDGRRRRRMNGTIVGGLVGGGLFLLSLLAR
jgi:hypothetical protein